ncbi:MAG: hypothetical protein K6T75_06290 [Acetobacteraceae bacterium]|nr:hypothetical protein [Acetobacteraceae bacterium]
MTTSMARRPTAGHRLPSGMGRGSAGARPARATPWAGLGGWPPALRAALALGLALVLGPTLGLALALGGAASGCGPRGPAPADARLRQTLSALPCIEIPAMRAEGAYGAPFVRSVVLEAQAQARELLAGERPPPLVMFFRQLEMHSTAAGEVLEALEAGEDGEGRTGGGGTGPATPAPGRTPQAVVPASSALALEEANTALANAEAIRAYFHMRELGAEAFRQEAEASLAEALTQIESRRSLVLEAERAETSLTRYFHLPLAELALEGAQEQATQAQELLTGAGELEDRLFLAGSNLAMIRHKLQLFDYLWERRLGAPEAPALDRPVSAVLPAPEQAGGCRGPSPFPPDTQAHRRWVDGQGYHAAAEDLARRGLSAMALGEAANARAAEKVAPWLEKVRVGPPPPAGSECDLAAIRRLVARSLAEARDRTLRLEARGVSLPWIWTSLASVSAAMARSDAQLRAALGAGPGADLPTLEETLALSYADSLGRSLRCLYLLDAVEGLLH